MTYLRLGGRMHGISSKKTQCPAPRTILRLLDLEQSKNAVLNSLAATSSQESYCHAMEEFITCTVLNLACRSAAPWFFDTDSSLSRSASLRRR